MNKTTEDYKVGDLIYDANIYDGLNTNLHDLDFYKSWLPQNKDAKILELCCGTGRLTIPIAQAGHNITGVDFTVSMLDKAKSKALEVDLKIDFIEADIKTLDLGTLYDFIFIPFNSIHHLYHNEDLFKVFTMVKKHLEEGGLFMFDCYNPNIEYIVSCGKELTNIAAYQTIDGREVLIKQLMRYESATQINRIAWHYYINNEFHSVQNMDMRLYFPQELNFYLEKNGFKVMHKFGSFESDLFENNSEKQIFVCQ
jgi:2-polyprenyl-3-methyl-5-hydroxy-6-metoxy-1,4-benzoquinol methylase